MRACIDCGADLRMRHESHMRCVACYVATLHKAIADGTHHFKEELDALPPLRSGLEVDIEQLSEEKIHRTKRMRAMSKQGMTLESISKQFDLSRERVRQILKRVGATKSRNEFLSKAKEAKLAKQSAIKEARSFAKWGMSVSDAKEANSNGVMRAFVQQRNSAAKRGIGFEISFSEWIAIWNASGKLELRGRGSGRYCMSRLLDTGGYSVGNVHIQTVEENSREARTKRKPRNP